MLWGFLERKAYEPAIVRYQRERRIVPVFYNNGLNTPQLLDFNDATLTLEFQTLELTDLVELFQDPSIHRDDKLQYLRDALEQLRGIHNLGESHGDPHLKNFFRLNRHCEGRGRIYTCDFEYERQSPHPQVTDILILTADAIHLLNGHHPESSAAAFALIREVYGREIRFPFDLRDWFFYRTRFGMWGDFFKNFS